VLPAAPLPDPKVIASWLEGQGEATVAAVVVDTLPVVGGEAADVAEVPGVAVVAVDVVADADEWVLLPHPPAITAKPSAAMQSFLVLVGRIGINLLTPAAAVRESAAQPIRWSVGGTGGSEPGCPGSVRDSLPP
jgi:hypothetical protein